MHICSSFQVGKGPHASEVSGIVKIGQTMTMVLGVKDDENKFDMMVRNCVAHDGQRWVNRYCKQFLKCLLKCSLALKGRNGQAMIFQPLARICRQLDGKMGY